MLLGELLLVQIGGEVGHDEDTGLGLHGGHADVRQTLGDDLVGGLQPLAGQIHHALQLRGLQQRRQQGLRMGGYAGIVGDGAEALDDGGVEGKHIPVRKPDSTKSLAKLLVTWTR